MNSKTKLILSILGISAIIVPTVFLIWYSSRLKSGEQLTEESRNIDSKVIQETINRIPKQESALPASSPATASASPQTSPILNPTSQGSPSAR